MFRIGLMVVSNTRTTTLERSSQAHSSVTSNMSYGVTINCPGLPAMKGSITHSNGTFRWSMGRPICCVQSQSRLRDRWRYLLKRLPSLLTTSVHEFVPNDTAHSQPSARGYGRVAPTSRRAAMYHQHTCAASMRD